tara:strand:+ start:387 stop:521 length:135 start_codon:yes stop_codon:yes gene_type:complete
MKKKNRNKKTITYTELGIILTKALDKLHAKEAVKLRHIPANKNK